MQRLIDVNGWMVWVWARALRASSWGALLALFAVAACGGDSTDTEAFLSIGAEGAARGATSVRVEVDALVIELPRKTWPLELVVEPGQGEGEKAFSLRAWGLKDGAALGAAKSKVTFQAGARKTVSIVLDPEVELGTPPAVNGKVAKGQVIKQPSSTRSDGGLADADVDHDGAASAVDGGARSCGDRDTCAQRGQPCDHGTCGAGLECRPNGTCQLIAGSVAQCGECYTRDDCALGLDCTPEPDGSASFCVDPCTKDADCDAGFLCNGGHCWPDSGYTCRGVGKHGSGALCDACRGSEDCADGFACYRGECFKTCTHGTGGTCAGSMMPTCRESGMKTHDGYDWELCMFPDGAKLHDGGVPEPVSYTCAQQLEAVAKAGAGLCQPCGTCPTGTTCMDSYCADSSSATTCPSGLVCGKYLGPLCDGICIPDVLEGTDLTISPANNCELSLLYQHFGTP
jgi:hypothetical protein